MTTADNYNKERRKATIEWAMIDHMKNPTPGFEDAIKYHFLHHKKAITEQAKAWQKKDGFKKSLLTDLEKPYAKLEGKK